MGMKRLLGYTFTYAQSTVLAPLKKCTMLRLIVIEAQTKTRFRATDVFNTASPTFEKIDYIVSVAVVWAFSYGMYFLAICIRKLSGVIDI